MSVELRFENVFTGCSTCNAEPGECTCAEQGLDPEESYQPTAILEVGLKRAACERCKGRGREMYNKHGEIIDAGPCGMECPDPATELREGLPRLVAVHEFCEDNPDLYYDEEVEGCYCDGNSYHPAITNRILRIQRWEGWREVVAFELAKAIGLQEGDVFDLNEKWMSNALQTLGITLEILPCPEPGCEGGVIDVGEPNPTHYTKEPKPCPRCGGEE